MNLEKSAIVDGLKDLSFMGNRGQNYRITELHQNGTEYSQGRDAGKRSIERVLGKQTQIKRFERKNFINDELKNN